MKKSLKSAAAKAPKSQGKSAKKPAPKGSRKRAKGSLFLIATLLIGSATLRVGIGASEALAREEPLMETPVAAMTEPQTCDQPEDMRELMAVFKERESRIVRQEAEIKSRLKALHLADEEVSQKLAALENAEGRLRSLIAMAETAAEDDVTQLTQVYETMKPKSVAALFEEMDPQFAAGFIARMKPESAAGILAGMNPEAAYTISVILAGRNANTPTE